MEWLDFKTVFLSQVYPTVCNAAFSVYECRQLSRTEMVLEDDYAISCLGDNHRYVRYISGAVVVATLSLPLYMTKILLNMSQKLTYMSAIQQQIVDATASRLNVPKQSVANAMLDVTEIRADGQSFLWQFLIVNGVKGSRLYW